METRNDNTESILKLIKLPDLLSILNALFGFSAILIVLSGVNEEVIEKALVFILVAAVIDGLDGMVARNMECSSLGKYLDSLADMVSFGVAPAIVAYAFLNVYYTYVSLALCGAYMISGLLRLARFDAKETRFSFSTNLSLCGAPPHDPASPVRAYKKALPKKLLEKEKEYFEGFPITGGAIFLASFMLVFIELHLPFYPYSSLLIALIGILCLLMTSRIRYRNMRDGKIVIPVGIVFFMQFFFYKFVPLHFVYPAAVIFALSVFYICSPIVRVFALRK
ncbi:MAG: CDP-alcohol phosphatidyltransferase family protein [Methanophagales archaeon]|nr:CDP-alcohol phosphatidyltransferase family protein [Methanophagales archaeon]